MKEETKTELLTEKAVRRMSRRELLKMTPIMIMGAFAIPGLNEKFIKRGLDLTDRATEQFFSSRRMAQTFSDRSLTPLERFPINSYSEYDPANDLAKWTLSVEGVVKRPGEYTLDQIKSLPKQTQNVRHLCIEGWEVIGNFAGARMADFLNLVGADEGARFVEVACLDDYYTSYDMASCLHPQSLLCYEMYGQPLAAGHGAPLRIHMPVKLGYKSAKHLYSLRVSNLLRKDKGFWEDLGYSWYGGI
jgi:DMSO/TMAO reductase YedYZ molybdopterin-dependent catalytic subunit